MSKVVRLAVLFFRQDLCTFDVRDSSYPRVV